MKALDSFSKRDCIKIVLLDFDGVFTTNSVIVDEEGMESVTCSRYDGFGISELIARDILVSVITTETKPMAKHRCDKLGIECLDSVENKKDSAQQILANHGLDFDSCCFFGNDINDLTLLSCVRLPVVTPDCHCSVRNDDFYVTKIGGGKGCIRELADFLVGVKS